MTATFGDVWIATIAISEISTSLESSKNIHVNFQIQIQVIIFIVFCSSVESMEMPVAKMSYLQYKEPPSGRQMGPWRKHRPCHLYTKGTFLPLKECENCLIGSNDQI